MPFAPRADFDLDVSHVSEQWRHAIQNSENLIKFTQKTEVGGCGRVGRASLPARRRRVQDCPAREASRRASAMVDGVTSDEDDDVLHGSRETPECMRGSLLHPVHVHHLLISHLALYRSLLVRVWVRRAGARSSCDHRLQLHFINPPREGKFLLVLDLDHTLLDFTSKVGGEYCRGEVGRAAFLPAKGP